MEDSYGGFWMRVIAHAVDTIILSVFVAIFGVVTSIVGMNPVDPSGQFILSMSITGFIFFYSVSMNFLFAGTIGKRVLGLQVLDSRTLEKITFTQSCVRSFTQFISAFVVCLGYISVAFSKRKQGWHDLMAGTVVVKDSCLDEIRQEEERIHFSVDDDAA